MLYFTIQYINIDSNILCTHIVRATYIYGDIYNDLN